MFTMSIVRKSFNGHLKNPDEWKSRTVEDLGLRSLNLEPRFVVPLDLVDPRLIYSTSG